MCECDFCKTYDQYRWATIMECKCVCHDTDNPIGHDSLCCEFPNGLRKDNPYTELKSAEYYKSILNEFYRQDEENLKPFKI